MANNVHNDGNLKISFQEVGNIEWKSQKEVGSQVEMKGEFTTADGRKFEVCVNYNKEPLKGTVGDTSDKIRDKVKEFFNKFEKQELSSLAGHTMTASLKDKNIDLVKKEGVESKNQPSPELSNILKKANEMFKNVFSEGKNEKEEHKEISFKIDNKNSPPQTSVPPRPSPINKNKEDKKPIPEIPMKKNTDQQTTNVKPPLSRPPLTTNLEPPKNLPPPKHLQPPRPLGSPQPIQPSTNQNIEEKSDVKKDEILDLKENQLDEDSKIETELKNEILEVELFPSDDNSEQDQKIDSSLLNTMPNPSRVTSDTTIDPELIKTMPSPSSVIDKEELPIDEKKPPEQLHGIFTINTKEEKHRVLLRQVVEMEQTEQKFNEVLNRLKTDLTVIQDDSLKDELSLINDLESMSGKFALEIGKCINEEKGEIDVDKLQKVFTDPACAQYLKKIGEYANNYNSFFEKLNAGGENSIAKKIDKKRGKEDSSSVSEVMQQAAVDLSADVIAPVQRGPRYMLYLNEFEKQVPGIAVSSQTKVSGYMKEINENKRAYDIKQNVNAIIQELHPFTQQGQSVKINKETNKLEVSHFSDGSEKIGPRVMTLLKDLQPLNSGFAQSYGKTVLIKKDFRKFLKDHPEEKETFAKVTGLKEEFVNEKLNSSRKKSKSKINQPPNPKTKENI